MRPDTIILHHSATEDGPTVSWGAIRAYHTSWKCQGESVREEDIPSLNARGLFVAAPWDDIGYHFGIERVGGSYEIFAGRMPDMSGAHCRDSAMNQRSIGICFVGDFDAAPVPDAMLEKGLELVRYLMRTYNIPMRRVMGHREVSAYKTCPGRWFPLNHFRENLMIG